MSESAQAEQVDLNGEVKEDAFTAEIDAHAFVPFLRALDFVGEYRLQIDSDGLHVCVSDPATVAMADVTLHADAFESFETEGDDLTIGVDHSHLSAAVSFARYSQSTSDTIRLEYGEMDTLRVSVERDLNGINVVGERRLALIPWESVREPPDVPSLDLPATASIPTSAFVTLVREFPKDEHIRIMQDGNNLTFAFEGEHDTIDYTASIDGDGQSESLFSTAYLHDLASSLNALDVDTLDLHTGEEFPIRIEFANEGVYNGMYMLAPRIREGPGE